MTLTSESVTTIYTHTGQCLMMMDFKVTKNQDLGLYEGTLTINLPEITVTRYKADKNDFKYELRRAVSEIVEEIIEKNIDD